MRYTTILFDLDGTLLNTLDDLCDATNYALRNSGFPERDIKEIRQFVGNGVRKLIERAVPASTDVEATDKCFAIFVDYYSSHSRVKTDLYPGIRDLICRLDEMGVKMAIVTNKLQSASEALQQDFFDPYIKVVVGDAPGRNKKPHPDGVNEALAQLKVTDKSKVLYIGDSDVDAETAINSGLDYVLCLWGFRDKCQLDNYSPIAFIEKPSQLLDSI